MNWTWLDLLLFTGAAYGIAWLITRSKLTRPLRSVVAGVPFLGELLQCIVCTATWVGLVLMFVLPWSTLFSSGFRVGSIVDVLVLTGWVLASSWGIGWALGDARTEEEAH